ncbi:hypothetical protein [Brevibacterium sp. UBA7493]|uniref:hypothetical protein n=1 Tax=Brevibacterium sp. UBA7493 TaxID=1946121 RepID=UPI00257FD728|nr:hypothetical protein [Brevibacterium sp. UBA7493]
MSEGDVLLERVRVGTRQWDHVFPIAMGDISSTAGRRVDLVRLDHTPDLWEERNLTAGETSLSRYVRRRAAGDDSVIGLPIFLMRGFRHRCIIVRSDSEAHSLSDLNGARIGVTGWPDSGNTWTRALLVDAGVDLTAISWTVGRLTADHPDVDRLDGVVPRHDYEVRICSTPMVELLNEGELDAVFTPFMPPGFSDPGSGMRRLFDDVTGEEQRFLSTQGYIPGIHILAVRAEAAETDSALPADLGRMFRESEQLAAVRHRKLLDVTPWLNMAVELFDAAGVLDPNPVGLDANAQMLSDFIGHMRYQGLVDDVPPLSELFPFDLTEAGLS